MRRLTDADYPLVVLALVLSAFGIATVYSAGQTDVSTSLAGLWRMQSLYLALGLGAAWVVSRARVRLLDNLTPVVYGGAVFVLLLLLFIGRGAGTGKSTHSWIYIGDVSIGQPSELAKIAVVLMLAKVLARGDAPKTLPELWKPAVVVAVPWVLIMLQPDLGTGLVFIAIFFAMLYWAGASWQLLVMVASPVVSLALAFSTRLWGAWFILIVLLIYWSRPHIGESVAVVAANLAFGVVAPFLWDHLSAYQQRRLLVYLDPSSDPLRGGYHVLQSQVAIGSGGWLGKGFTHGTQKRLAFLPEQHTDFIFPVLGEELGFVGVVVALGLFAWLMMRCIRIAARSQNPFASLVAFGLVAMLFFHVIENVGMTIGVMPITGIPLPFFSYGGSFMLACWIAVGLLIRLSLEGRGQADTLVI
ncbi:MAG TPA: rod shape-determining protein RodA [Gemmatimonadaceae bacterium]|nr:rod shape-determining protein RodA [Gemmatimonadaceae bacterium]